MKLDKKLKVALNNYQIDNNIIYDKIINYQELMKRSLSLIEDSNSINELYNVKENARNIRHLVLEAKSNGIDNENYLSQGNDIISDLQKELENLYEKFNSLNNKHINIIEFNKLKKISPPAFICNIHNNIYIFTEYIEDIVNKLTDKVIEKKIDNIEEYINNLLCNCSNIKNEIDSARNMNERMGKGIDKKNQEIMYLQKKINRLISSLSM